MTNSSVLPPPPPPPPPSVGRVEVEIEALDFYCYAMSHRPLVRNVVLTNVSVDPKLGEMVVSLAVEAPGAEPPLHETVVAIPIPEPRDHVSLKTVRLVPNPKGLAGLDEAVSANLVVKVTVDGQQVGVHRRSLQVLAFNQWMHRRESFDSYSAFVLPHDPSLAPILDRARQLLGERTGEPVTDGYQGLDRGQDDRPLHIAHAVYDALAERRLGYSNPPASFEGFGQKIRTPDVVFAENCATCLDSSVLYASALAAAGLDPVLILVKGHAFAGFLDAPSHRLDDAWSRELTRKPVLYSPNEIGHLVTTAVVVPVETTTLTASPEPTPFKAAVASKLRYFQEHIGDVEGLVNVRSAREQGVSALPARRRVGEMVEIVPPPVERAAPPEPAPERLEPAEGTEARARREAFEAPARVKAWLSSLLDLSYANPLLNLKDGRGGFRFEMGPGELAAVEDRLMSSDKGIELLPASKAPDVVLDADDITAAAAAQFLKDGRLYWPSPASVEPLIDHRRRQILAERPQHAPAHALREAELVLDADMTSALDKKINAVRRRAREIETQVGSNNLFVTIGAVSWKDPPGSRRRTTTKDERHIAPLFLIPVRVTGSASTAFRIVADAAAEVVPNYCLLEKLRQTFDFLLPELEQPELDHAGIDVDRMIAAVRKSLAASNITDVLVEETAYLAVLNFSTFRLWKDMRDHWKDFMSNSVVRHLIETPYESFEHEPTATAPLTREELLLPVETDESQLEAVHWAVSGRSFVIEGPPGTGKSQTIANLLAAAIAAKRTVLFVAEKQAALSVVKKRLEKVGLTPFCLDLHDKGSKPEQIRQQLKAALDFAGEDREQEWDELCARRAADEAALTAYRDAIHDKNAAELSAWSARQELLQLGDGPSIPIDREFVDTAPRHLSSVRDALLALPGVTGPAGVLPGAPWSLSGADDFRAVDQPSLAEIIRAVEAGRLRLLDLHPRAMAVVRTIEGPAELSSLADLLHDALLLRTIGEAELAEVAGPAWAQRRDEALQQVHSFLADQAPVRQVLTDAAYSVDLNPFIASGTEAATAGFFGRGKKEKTFKLTVQPVLKTPTDLPTEQLVGLLQRASAGATARNAVLGSLARLPGASLSATFDVFSAEQVADLEARLRGLPARAAALRAGRGAEIRAALREGWEPDISTVGMLRDVAAAWQRLIDVLHITPETARRWHNGRAFLDAWTVSAQAWMADAPRFLQLQRWTEIVSAVRPLAQAGLTAAASGILRGDVPVTEAYDRFRRGLLLAATDERYAAGKLHYFDALAHGRRLEEFVQRDSARRTLMQSVIPQRLVAARPFKPGVRIGVYGSLERELSKTTRRLGVRKLVERYGEILPTLTPCFLMSPDSVARFLPPGQIGFDMVVFDEASQIEVAQSVGAMGRAKSVVVVGDSRQMPPSKFGGTVAAPDENEEIAEEAIYEDLESILSECVESNLPRVWLKCHYRSRHEGLITFSNNAFYKGELTTFPSPHDSAIFPISWHRVDGEFLRSGKGDRLRTNPVEAEAIVAEIRRRLDDPHASHETICVVTLNIQQANLIRQLLDESGDERIRTLLEDESERGLIVRNLESVQGDERDVVMISVAFAPSLTRGADGEVRRGKLPLNFGPLNRKGGERRLNVAVTRARSEVLVFCSYDPEEMYLAEEPARGLELLKEYLSVARDGARRSADLAMRAPSADDHHRREIVGSLQDAGLRVRENIGLSKFRVDLAVGAGGATDWPVAILLDGPGWAARTTVYDRDALPPNVLAMMGWRNVLRIWLPSWMQERDRVIADIVNAVTTVGAEPPVVERQPATPTPAPPPAPRKAAFAGDRLSAPAAVGAMPTAHIGAFVKPPEAGLESTFVSAPTNVLGPREVLDRLDMKADRDLVLWAIRNIVQAEAPIHLDRLGKIVGTRFGMGAVRQTRIDDIAKLVNRSQVRRSKFGAFVWSDDWSPDHWRGYRRTPRGVERKIEHIAPEEVVNAMVDLVRMGHSVEVDELLRHTAEVFGFFRLSAPIRERLSEVLKWATSSMNRLVADGDRITGATRAE